MIAKRITSKATKPRAARLVKYMVAAEGKLDPRSWTRTADYMLASAISTRGEKVGGVRVTNCNTDDPAAATTLIEVTQAVNTRSKTDKTYHLVFSFPPGEEPPLHILHKIEDELIKAIGFEQHQRISAVHIDCDHLHVHVAINKVHPTGFQNIEPYFDKKKLMEACERLEIEYGLTRTNHGLTGERKREKDNKQFLTGNGTHSNIRPHQSRKIDTDYSNKNGGKNRTHTDNAAIAGKAADAEAHSGIETLIGHVSRDVAPAMHKAKSWQELHAVLYSVGLEIKKRGAGLVIGNGTIWAKASQCDRAFSLKSLSDRLGAFEAPQKKPEKVYQPQPRQSHPSSVALFEQYQQERLRLRVARENGIKQIDYEAAMMEHHLKKWNVAQRLIVKAGMKGPTRKVALAAIKLQTDTSRRNNWNKTQADRQRLFTRTHSPSWPDWLIQQSKTDINALAVLRERYDREKRRGNCLSAGNVGDHDHTVIHYLQPQIDRKGAVTYRTADGGMVIDRATHVQCFRTTKGSAQLAVELAAERFQGQALIVEGQEQFKKDVARLAGIYGVRVRFADSAMEQIRQVAQQDTPKKQYTKSKEAEL
jgi:hypothetical protein